MSYTHRYQPLRGLQLDRRYATQMVGWRRKNVRWNRILATRSTSPSATPSITAVGLEDILSEDSSASSHIQRTSKKSNAKNIEKWCSCWQNENVPPAFEQYKIQGNVSDLVQSHFGSPCLKEFESGIAPLDPVTPFRRFPCFQ